MRLGSANSYDKSLQNIAARQSDLSSQQEKLTSGKKINRPSDDPTGAAQAERSLTRLARIATDQRALGVQANAITLAESALGDATSLVQGVRDLVVSAGNGTYTAADRASIARQMQGLREQLLSIANRTDANNTPLFGGLGSALVPFTQSSTGVVSFNGVGGQNTSTDTTVPGAMDGQAIWMNVAADPSNPSSAKTNLFAIVDTAIAGIGSTTATNAAVIQTVSLALSQIDAGLDQIQSARGQAGAWLNRVDNIFSTQQDRTLTLAADKSRAEDIDMVTGISDFQKMQTGYQAALQSYAQVQKLSLFNYIS
jgi:flagellar hook-associated protein 3 FlgL